MKSAARVGCRARPLPLRRIAVRVDCLRPCHQMCRRLPRLRAPRSVVSVVVRGCWLTASRRGPGRFRLTFAVFRATASPRPIAETGSSSLELLLLFEAMVHLTGPPAPADGAPPMRFLSPRRHRPSDPRLTPFGASDLSTIALRSVSSVPPALDGLIPLDLSRSVSPASHLRFPFRDFPRKPAGLARTRPVPSCRYPGSPESAEASPPARRRSPSGRLSDCPVRGPELVD